LACDVVVGIPKLKRVVAKETESSCRSSSASQKLLGAPQKDVWFLMAFSVTALVMVEQTRRPPALCRRDSGPATDKGVKLCVGPAVAESAPRRDRKFRARLIRWSMQKTRRLSG
jgi:hypothetical protein